MIEHSDYFYLVFFVLIILATGVISEGLAKKQILHKELARKIFHFIAVLLAAYSAYVFVDYKVLIVASSIAVVLTFIAVYKNLIPSIHHDRELSWGIFLFPLAFFLSLILLGKENREIISLSFLVLALSDSLAAITGTFLSKNFFRLTSDKKSLIGSITFFIVTIIILTVIPRELNFSFEVYLSFEFLVVLALVLTVFEAVSSKGLDNFFVPTVSSILLLIYTKDPLIQSQFVIGVFLALIVAVLSYKAKFLTKDGSAATFLLAGIVFGLGGWKWSLPILTFFILSSLLSKIRKSKNEEVELHFEKTGTRDYLQVIANGGIGGLLVILDQFADSNLIYLIYIASLAAVCADTWATEIGTLKKRTTYNILNFKPVQQGISGGISVYGTVGAILGAFVIAVSGIFWIDIFYMEYLLLIVITGLVGSLFDSILGATIQSQNKCLVCNSITEKKIHCGEPTFHHNGFKWLNNDMVNFFAGLSGGLLILVLVW